jgi:hypothetical protein
VAQAVITVAVSSVIKAAQEFHEDESKRKRKRFSVVENAELALALQALQRQVDSPLHRAQRGEIATDLFGYNDSYDEVAATVIADIMWAVQLRGHDPQQVLAMASGYFNQDMDLD